MDGDELDLGPRAGPSPGQSGDNDTEDRKRDRTTSSINEEIEMKASLALLRFGDGLKGHERRSVWAVVAPLDRHVSAPGPPGTPRIPEEAFPERG